MRFMLILTLCLLTACGTDNRNQYDLPGTKNEGTGQPERIHDQGEGKTIACNGPEVVA